MIIYLFFYMLQGKDFDDLHDFIKKKTTCIWVLKLN